MTMAGLQVFDRRSTEGCAKDGRRMADWGIFAAPVRAGRPGTCSKISSAVSKNTLILAQVFIMHSSLTYKNQCNYCFLMATLAMDSTL